MLCCKADSGSAVPPGQADVCPEQLRPAKQVIHSRDSDWETVHVQGGC